MVGSVNGMPAVVLNCVRISLAVRVLNHWAVSLGLQGANESEPVDCDKHWPGREGDEIESLKIA